MRTATSKCGAAELRTTRFRVRASRDAVGGDGIICPDTLKYINSLPADALFIDSEIARVPCAVNVTGTVDMKGYLDWLSKTGYGLDITVHWHDELDAATTGETQAAQADGDVAVDWRMQHGGASGRHNKWRSDEVQWHQRHTGGGRCGWGGDEWGGLLR